MSRAGWSREWTRFLSDYGMVFVLLILCVYYSWATLTVQQPEGAAAGRAVAKQLSGQTGSVFLAANEGEDGTAFLDALEKDLAPQTGMRIAGRAQGTPREARQALEKIAADGKKLDFIAATRGASEWPLWNTLAERFPILGAPKLTTAASYRWPAFLTSQNLLNVANQITVVAILAIGMTIVIITGGIDLSAGSLIALAAVMASVMIRDFAGGAQATAIGLIGCCALAVLTCGMVGAFSGVMIAGFKVPPFIATLAVMQVASGLAFIIARGGSIYEVPDSFTWLGRGATFFSLPNGVLLMGLLYLAAHVLMTRTTIGRRLYAVGGNPEAARLSGVNVGAMLILAYTLSGAMAGLGGVLLASQLKSGAPTYGTAYELYVIAAVVVGGTSLAGGEGRILGTLIGAFIIGVIQNGMNLTSVESYRQKVVLGLVILGAVLLDMLKKRDWRRVFHRPVRLQRVP